MTVKRSTTRKPKDPGGGGPPRKPRRPTGIYMTNWPTWFEIDGTGYARKDKFRRKGGLEFVRLFVSAGGTKSTESSQFIQLQSVLRSISPEHYHANVGTYFALVALTATLERCYRGWLLDENLQPLTEKGLAQRLFLDLATMHQAIKDLLASGLIRRQPLPDFDPGADDAPEEDGDHQADRRRREDKPPRKSLENKHQNRPCGKVRKSAEICGSLIRSRSSKDKPNKKKNFEDVTTKAERAAGPLPQGSKAANGNRTPKTLTCPTCGHEGEPPKGKPKAGKPAKQGKAEDPDIFVPVKRPEEDLASVGKIEKELTAYSKE